MSGNVRKSLDRPSVLTSLFSPSPHLTLGVQSEPLEGEGRSRGLHVCLDKHILVVSREGPPSLRFVVRTVRNVSVVMKTPVDR